MIGSLRGRITLGCTLGVAVVAGLASWAFYSSAAAIQRRELDGRLRQQARTLAALTSWEAGERDLELEFSDGLMPDYLPGPDACYFELWRGDGSVLERSRSLGGGDLPGAPWDAAAVEPGSERWFDLPLPDGRPGRAVRIGYEVDEGFRPAGGAFDVPAVVHYPLAVVTVARSRAELDEGLVALRWTVAVTGCALAGAAALVVSLLVAMGLRPLRRLGDAVARLDPHELPPSVAAGPMLRELRPIRERLDELLQRVRAALARERRMAANLAHELRTPLAELQSLTEVASRWPDDEAHRERALRTAHAISRRMSMLVETILRLARASQGEFVVRREPVCLVQLLRDVWRELAEERRRAGATAMPPTPPGELPTTLSVPSDAGALRIVLANLLDNAIEYGGGAVPSLRLARVGDDVLCELRNPATGVTAADLSSFGERFWRGDRARAQGDGSHAGLGLALARELCSRIGATLDFALHDGDVVATLRVPIGG